jgi:hypothetical protein
MLQDVNGANACGRAFRGVIPCTLVTHVSTGFVEQMAGTFTTRVTTSRALVRLAGAPTCRGVYIAWTKTVTPACHTLPHDTFGATTVDLLAAGAAVHS